MTGLSELEIPGYEVLEILGQGGFGVVYRARQLAVGREVALKVDNRVLVSERDRRRFVREVTSAGALSGHPHVAHVYDAGVLPDGRPYIVMELCPGGSLLDRMRERRLAPGEVADIGVRIADALAAAHAVGVLHRDVKPANILINRYGNVVLSDFGLATMPSASGGEISVTREALTPAYAPPEAFDLTEPTPLGDVYSLAATLYALLSGRPPRFPESGVVNVAIILALHRRPIPEIPGVPAGLTAVLRDAMASDPARRTPSAAALRDALAALHLDDAPYPPSGARPGGTAPPPSGGPPGHRPPGPPREGGPYASRPLRNMPAPAPAPTGPQTGRHTTPSGLSAPPGPGGLHAADQHTSPKGHHAGPRRPATYPTVAPPPGLPGSPNRVYAAVAGVFVILLLVGVVLMVLETEGLTPWAAPPAIGGTIATPAGSEGAPAPSGEAGDRAADAPGVATVGDGCPAAAVADAKAACVKTAECWGGLIFIAGELTVRRIACEEPHVWETFAVAPLPGDALTVNLKDLEQHPVVGRTCSRAVLLASRNQRARTVAPARWQVAIMPPTREQFDRGLRAYRCVGGVLGATGRLATGTFFRPLSS